MVQGPCKGEITGPAAVAPRLSWVFGGGGEAGDGSARDGAPASDAEQALDPVHALSRDEHLVATLGSLHGHERAAEGVIARGEVAAGTGAHERGVGGVDAAVAGMKRVDRGEDHGRVSVVGRSISLVLHRNGPRRPCTFRSVNVSRTDGDR